MGVRQCLRKPNLVRPRFAKPAVVVVMRRAGSSPVANAICRVCWLAQRTVLKTAGCNRSGGSIPSHGAKEKNLQLLKIYGIIIIENEK